jgi:hypothetical protein
MVSSNKRNSYLFWMLAIVLALASVDTIPDPPAVNPHTVNLVSRICEAGVSVCEQTLNSGWFYESSLMRASRIAISLSAEPTSTREWIVSTGQAADPSPPFFPRVELRSWQPGLSANFLS